MVSNSLVNIKRSREALLADLAAADPNIKAALTGPLNLATKEEAALGQSAVQPDDLQEALSELIVGALNGDSNYATTTQAKIDAKANKLEVEQALSQKATSIQGTKADTAVQPADMAQAIANLIANTLLGDPQFGANMRAILDQKASINTLASVSFSGSANDVQESVSRRFVTQDEKAKLGNLTITKQTNLDMLVERVQSLSGGFSVRGEWDASTGSFPLSADFGPIFAGNVFIVTTGGTVDGEAFDAGDRLLALIDSPSASSYGQNWFKEDYTAEVSSVAGRVGNVVLEVDDLVDSTQIGQDLVRAHNRSAARTTIGAQADNPLLTSISATGIFQDKILYGVGPDVVTTTDLTPLARTLLAKGTQSEMKTALGLHAVATSGSWNDLVNKPDLAGTYYTKTQMDASITTLLPKAGGTLTGPLTVDNSSEDTKLVLKRAGALNWNFDTLTTGTLRFSYGTTPVLDIKPDSTTLRRALFEVTPPAGSAGLRLKAASGQACFLDMSPNGITNDYYWRIVSQADGNLDIIKDGVHAYRFNGTQIWTQTYGWLNDRFADRGAQVQHNSGIWEFGSIDPNYNDLTQDAPNPWVLVGLRSSRGTNVINLRAIWLRNN